MALLDQDLVEFRDELATIKDVLRWCVTKFEQNSLFYGHGTDNAWDEAVVLLMHYLRLSSESFAQVLDAKLTTSDKEYLYYLICKRINDKLPLPYITNEAWFCNMVFYVDERVLIPRSPIAELIQQGFRPWLTWDIEQGLRALEIGTGSGCIACAIVDYFLTEGSEIQVDATDISNDALDVASHNIENYGFEQHINLINSDLFSNIGNKKYNLIISNPPYVDADEMASLPQEYLHEPHGALAAGIDGLDLVKIMLKQAYNYLTDDGVIIIEVGISRVALEQMYPQVAFTWLDFVNGGEGVFLLTKQQLEHCKN